MFAVALWWMQRWFETLITGYLGLCMCVVLKTWTCHMYVRSNVAYLRYHMSTQVDGSDTTNAVLFMIHRSRYHWFDATARWHHRTLHCCSSTHQVALRRQYHCYRSPLSKPLSGVTLEQRTDFVKDAMHIQKAHTSASLRLRTIDSKTLFDPGNWNIHHSLQDIVICCLRT